MAVLGTEQWLVTPVLLSLGTSQIEHYILLAYLFIHSLKLIGNYSVPAWPKHLYDITAGYQIAATFH